jgi:hypothetical protein
MDQKETTAAEPSEMALVMGPGLGPLRELKPERVQKFLEAWPDWTLGMEGRSLLRTRVFPNPTVASSYGAFVTRFATAHGLPVSIDVQRGKVQIALFAPSDDESLQPLTEVVLQLAEALG